MELRELQRLIEEKVSEVEVSGVSVNIYNGKHPIKIKVKKKDLVPHAPAFFQFRIKVNIMYVQFKNN
ncbi:hypothetical protein [Fonticella tunisiensis]|uniref:Uncharacterized protein n=1 Tax=Fonticella tunisiensis TaxID=1096341 RepID=A0A4R7KSL9_9CLOT|nr:hypothetical protein [Fonticella tunisiensis]TDT62758.1 hypothetical protein EDD71_10331 [Fonticella tunisiensis]